MVIHRRGAACCARLTRNHAGAPRGVPTALLESSYVIGRAVHRRPYDFLAAALPLPLGEGDREAVERDYCLMPIG